MFPTSLRTHSGGLPTGDDAGRQVRLGGWVHRRRDLGGLVFIDLRDRYGLVQLSFDPAYTPKDVIERAAGCGVETVVLVSGTWSGGPMLRAMRHGLPGSGSPGQCAPGRRAGSDTGHSGRAEGKRRAPPRRSCVSSTGCSVFAPSFRASHPAPVAVRSPHAWSRVFEIETPILTKPTPEGARDTCAVRVHPAILRAAAITPDLQTAAHGGGVRRYFQIARCFRDEDLRRSPAGVHRSISASFVTQEDVLSVVESVLVALWDEAGHIPRPFPGWRGARRWSGSASTSPTSAGRIRDPGPHHHRGNRRGAFSA